MQDVFKVDDYKNQGIGYISSERMQDTWNLVNEYQAPLSYKLNDIYDASFLPNPMYKYNW